MGGQDAQRGSAVESGAHPARVYDFILGGTDNFPADRAAAEETCRHWPALPVHMRANRAFMHRATHVLAREHGVRQFLDIGSGLPTRPNLHEVAQQAAPDARVVYVDNDPLVLEHSRALLDGTSQGRIAYLDADMRKPGDILEAPGFRDTIDLGEPVGLTVIGVLHFLLDGDDAPGLLARLLEPLPPGSFLAASIATADFAPEEVGRVAREYEAQGMPMRLRTRAEAEALFTDRGLDLTAPGVVQVHHWRPGPDDEKAPDRDIAMYGAVARKP
ncbi:SAM-dependent methyltransferase [Streptomyces sp. ODS28]|uniref:SAM-dependent methyltransferase n=1 Tax=Streptomyces sp. ODS28 TaxID=3136688 RepID=UPI0031E7FD0D